VKRGLVPDEARGKFDAAIASAMRLRNSVLVEVLLIAFVYGIGVQFIWRNAAAVDVPTWFGMAAAGKLQPTLAGWWFGCVSLPIIQFLLLRWYFRLFIWTRFLWQVSRIKLKLVPTHPDRAGGLGFLSIVTYAFAPLVVAQGVLLAGVMANKIFYADAKLTDFKMGLFATVTMTFFPLWCRCWSSSRASRAPSARAWRNTARSLSATCASFTTNGCAAVHRPTNPWWAAGTSNPSPTWATAFKSLQA
jgi:hypothetical protein